MRLLSFPSRKLFVFEKEGNELIILLYNIITLTIKFMKIKFVLTLSGVIFKSCENVLQFEYIKV